jgi:hypothetical protein
MGVEVKSRKILLVPRNASLDLSKPTPDRKRRLQYKATGLAAYQNNFKGKSAGGTLW